MDDRKGTGTNRDKGILSDIGSRLVDSEERVERTENYWYGRKDNPCRGKRGKERIQILYQQPKNRCEAV